MNDKQSQKPKQATVKPNLERQEKVVEAVAENMGKTGKKNVSSAMIKSGYSKSYSANSEADKTLTFMEKFNKIMPEETILGWHNNLGNAKKTQQLQIDKAITDEYIEEWIASVNGVIYKIVEGKLYKTVLFWTRDNKAVKDAIDMAYKLRGDFAPQKHEEINANPFMKMSDSELAQALREAEAFLSKKSPNVPKSADTTESVTEKKKQDELKNNQNQNAKDS